MNGARLTVHPRISRRFGFRTGVFSQVGRCCVVADMEKLLVEGAQDLDLAGIVVESGVVRGR